jgi:hypothetical protein
MATAEIKDTGIKREFGTGAQRDGKGGRGRFDLVPIFPLLLVSRIYEDGAAKRGERNWEKGMPVSVLLNSCQRHISKHMCGMRDEPHLSMALWNLMGALWTSCMVHLGLRPKELYDLPNHVGLDPSPPLTDYEVEALEGFIGTSTPVR